MNDKHRLLLVGINDDEFKWAREQLSEHLGRNGIEVEREDTYPRTDVVDAAAAVNDEDMRNKKASWLREVPESVLTDVLDHAEKRHERVWGQSAIVTAEWDPLLDAIDSFPNWLETTGSVLLLLTEADPYETPDMEYQPRPPKNPDAPFSYDPAQDYYTEPDQ